MLALVVTLALLSGCRAFGVGAANSSSEASATPIPEPSSTTLVPQWCGGPNFGGPMPEASNTPRPVATADPARLRCIAVENRSGTAMAMSETRPGGLNSWTLLPACGGFSRTQTVDTRWSLQFGPPGKSEGTIDPIVATFDASQVTGPGPWLIEVDIDADGHVSVNQTERLPDNPTVKLC
jgi:hypothetical protein